MTKFGADSEKSDESSVSSQISPITPHDQEVGTSDFTLPVPNISYQETRVTETSPRWLEKNRIISALCQSEISDTYRILRTRILYRMDAFGFKSLAITSPNRGAGKTQTAINLALSLAMNVTRTVMLVDTDLRSPGVHKLLKIPAQPGLQDYLLNDAPLSRCLINPGVERLVILPLAEPLRNSSELLASPKMTSLARELRQRYPERIIIYDLPPVLFSDDALIFAKYVDCCLLVIDEGGTKKSELLQSLNFLEHLTIIGTVYNKASELRSIRY